jgi:hypothetical protein
VKARALIDRVVGGANPCDLIEGRMPAYKLGLDVDRIGENRLRVSLFNVAGLLAALKDAEQGEFPKGTPSSLRQLRLFAKVKPEAFLKVGGWWIGKRGQTFPRVKIDAIGSAKITVEIKDSFGGGYRYKTLDRAEFFQKLEPEVTREVGWRYWGQKVRISPTSAGPRLSQDQLRKLLQRYIIGHISLRYSAQCDAWEVRYSAARDGYGPLTYDVAMWAAGEEGMMADRHAVSLDAQRVWKYYHTRRTDVDSSPLPTPCARGKIPSLKRDYVLRSKLPIEQMKRRWGEAHRALKAAGATDDVIKRVIKRVSDDFFVVVGRDDA